MDKRRFLIVAIVACSLPYLGCASKLGSKSVQKNSGPALSKSSTPAPFNDPKYRALVQKIEKDGGTSSLPKAGPSVTKKFGAAVKHAGASVASALTLKPRVTKAPDPISLSSMPKSINANVYYQAGRLAESKNRRADAIKQYTKALERDPEHLPSIISLARLYDREENFTEAQRLYKQAIEADPKNALAYNDLGLCLARNQHEQEAVATLREAVSLAPNRKLYRNNLATVLVELGRVDEAWNELSGAHSDAVAHYNLGYLLYQDGDKQQAKRHFALACQQDPDLVAAKQMLAQLNGNAATFAATSEKVRYRVDDAAVAITPVAVGRRAKASPVAMVVSPRQLRRIPPTSMQPSDPAPKPPEVKLHGPVPVNPQPGQAPIGAPVEPSRPPSGMQFPVQPTSANVAPADVAPADVAPADVVQDNDEADLPTPQLLGEVAQR